MAERLADAIVTTSPASYPHSSPKVHSIGQAIDVGVFPYSPLVRTNGAFQLLALGRTAPGYKDFPTIVRATVAARERGTEDVRLQIVGPSTTAPEKQHRCDLEDLIASLGLGDIVQLCPGVEYGAIPNLMRQTSALVNATADGSGDKTVFEAAASGRPVLAASHTFDAFLEGLPLDLQFVPGDVDGLADRIVALAATPQALLDGIGRELRRRVEEHHSNDHWADELVAVAYPGLGLGLNQFPLMRTDGAAVRSAL